MSEAMSTGQVDHTYLYYPGCSLKASAREYDSSARAVMEALGYRLEELGDWNCCGATAVSSTDVLFSLVLPARNLALAEERDLPLVVACNSCYVTLVRAATVYNDNPAWRDRMGRALDAVGRRFKGEVRIRHLLDVIANDIPAAALRERCARPLAGLKVAPYYGCQIARPRNEFSDPELPLDMDRVLAAAGAEVVRYDLKTKCCGGALITTKEDIVLDLNNELLREAAVRGADVIATCCPMCQMNLDAYQGRINALFHTDYHLPIVYFTQLLGLAFNLPAAKVGIGRGFVAQAPALGKYGG